MKFLAALIPALKDLFIKLLVALGVTFVSYKGMDKIVDMFKSEISSAIKGVPADMLQIFYISGGGVAMNILFGGFTFWLGLQSATKITNRITPKGG